MASLRLRCCLQAVDSLLPLRRTPLEGAGCRLPCRWAWACVSSPGPRWAGPLVGHPGEAHSPLCPWLLIFHFSWAVSLGRHLQHTSWVQSGPLCFSSIFLRGVSWEWLMLAPALGFLPPTESPGLGSCSMLQPGRVLAAESLVGVNQQIGDHLVVA